MREGAAEQTAEKTSAVETSADNDSRPEAVRHAAAVYRAIRTLEAQVVEIRATQPVIQLLSTVLVFVVGTTVALAAAAAVLVAAAAVALLSAANIVVTSLGAGGRSRGQIALLLFATSDDRVEWASLLYEVRVMDGPRRLRIRHRTSLAIAYLPAVIRSQVTRLRHRIRGLG